MNNKKLAKTTMNLIGGLFEIGAEDVIDDPKVKEIVKELIKDLPPELTKEEIKNLTEEERINRNKKIREVKDYLHEIHNANDDTDRVFYSARKAAGQIPASYEHMRDGAIRSVARNEALKICNSRYIRTKEEIKYIKAWKKNFINQLAESYTK